MKDFAFIDEKKIVCMINLTVRGFHEIQFLLMHLEYYWSLFECDKSNADDYHIYIFLIHGHFKENENLISNRINLWLNYCRIFLYPFILVFLHNNDATTNATVYISHIFCRKWYAYFIIKQTLSQCYIGNRVNYSQDM